MNYDTSSFGLGPYLLSPGSLPEKPITIPRIKPNTGSNHTNSHQPLMFMSCNLLTARAVVGNIVAKTYRPESAGPSKPKNWKSMIISDMEINDVQRVNIQYSLRRARPLKTAYLLNGTKYQYIIPILLAAGLGAGVGVGAGGVDATGFGTGLGAGSRDACPADRASTLWPQLPQKSASDWSFSPHLIQNISAVDTEQ